MVSIAKIRILFENVSTISPIILPPIWDARERISVAEMSTKEKILDKTMDIRPSFQSRIISLKFEAVPKFAISSGRIRIDSLFASKSSCRAIVKMADFPIPLCPTNIRNGRFAVTLSCVLFLI